MLAFTYKLVNGQLRVTGYRNGEMIGQYLSDNPAEWKAGNTEVMFGIRHGSTLGGRGAIDALIEEAALYNEALPDTSIHELYRKGPDGVEWHVEPKIPTLTLKIDGDNLTLEFTGTLQSADTANGPWIDTPRRIRSRSCGPAWPALGFTAPKTDRLAKHQLKLSKRSVSAIISLSTERPEKTADSSRGSLRWRILYAHPNRFSPSSRSLARRGSLMPGTASSMQ
ncbi:MAG: hypothetical protein CM1200mP29_16760 [Verrucomicrobiota bacterium]|nr:MAG: hypothetical protein CM1200mP29_16760 [Verrucomicrobiota bacterium]